MKEHEWIGTDKRCYWCGAPRMDKKDCIERGDPSEGPKRKTASVDDFDALRNNTEALRNQDKRNKEEAERQREDA